MNKRLEPQILSVDVENTGELETVLQESEERKLINSLNWKLSDEVEFIDALILCSTKTKSYRTITWAYYEQSFKDDKLLKLNI